MTWFVGPNKKLHFLHDIYANMTLCVREMDLDNWTERVKDGQHLLEDELKRLCEYVSLAQLFTLIFTKLIS